MSRSFPKIFGHLRVFEFRRGEVGCARNQTYSSYFIQTDLACNCVRMVGVSDLSTLRLDAVLPFCDIQRIAYPMQSIAFKM